MDESHKKEFAAFYTPETLSDLLCSLAIKNPEETILEPSFGGCSFLGSSWKALSKIGSVVPQNQIYGCDVDEFAFRNLKKNFPNAVGRNFLHKDFLKTSPEDFQNLTFSTVIGNPPFLPVSKFNNKELAWRIPKQLDLDISKKASLWAYFVLHSVNFLKENGNLFFVVPDSLCFTKYGQQLQEFLKTRFRNITIVRFEERFFQYAGTGEKTAFLLCEEYGKDVRANFSELACDRVENFDLKKLKPHTKISNHLVSNSEIDYVRLSDICDCKIGIVTGANKYLLQKESWFKAEGLAKQFYYPILSKTKELHGIDFSIRDLKSQQGIFRLIDFKKLHKKDKKIYTKFKRKIPGSILTNTTFKYRTKHKKQWFDYDDKRKPDMFLSYHSANGPKLVRNIAKLNTTNSLHRIYLKHGYKSIAMQKILSITMFSSFVRTEALVNGRHYGSALKLEPGDAKNILVPIPAKINNQKVNLLYKQVNKLVRENNLAEATRLADSLIQTNDRY